MKISSLGELESFWVDSTKDTRFPKLQENIEVDVAVIGGGIVGITVAILLNEAGKNVAVIESRKIVKDVTGHTTAKITSLHGYKYKHLIDTFGIDVAKIYAEGNQSAIEFIAENIKKRNIDCDFERISAYTYTESDKMIGYVKEEVEAAIKLGLPASFTDKSKLPFSIKGAVKFENQAQFHPRKYLLALVNEFVEKGGKIFENTRALNLEEKRDLFRLKPAKTLSKQKASSWRPIFRFMIEGCFIQSFIRADLMF